MTGGRATPVSCRLGSVAVILAAVVTLAQGAGDTLYTYGLDHGDTSVAISHVGTTVTLPTGQPFMYYGQSFQNAYILKDGMVAFEPGVRFIDWEWREGTPNPAIDLPFIAPFHYDGFFPKTNPASYSGKIFYKLSSRASAVAEDLVFLDQLDAYLVNTSVALKSDFTSLFALKVTWENVSSESNCSDSALAGGCASNTFQVVLVGDLTRSFVIFNYYKMQIPFSESQLAGLNGGHGRGWTDVIPCGRLCAKRSKLNPSRINTLVSRSGSDVQGRYILYVNDDIIIRGGCLSDDLKSADGVEMEAFPRQTGMFGGEMLSVSGNCHPPGTIIYCRFGGNDHTTSVGVMETTMRGRCPVPLLTVRGDIPLEISIDNHVWKYASYITIILPSRLEWPIDMAGLYSAWYEINPSELRLQWPHDLFSSSPYATLDINLIGYREDQYAVDDPLIEKTLERLATGVSNGQQGLTLDPSQFSCNSGNSDCDDFEVGFLQLRVADQYVDNTTQYQFVNYGPLTLGWWVKNAMASQYGQDWATAKCSAWNAKNLPDESWLDHLLSCPCNLTQAVADWGRWQPDTGCSMYSGSVCTYHIGAKHCVRSVHPSVDGSGNQCCYEQDGSLRYAADTYQGSTPDHAHDWGALPYDRPGRVPSLSHWITDVVSFYYCCLWTDYAPCYNYMDRRATRDCLAYQPPHSAAVYGDPHITTFDGKHYYFGGSGEFWLLKSDRLNIQGRFDERANTYLDIQASTQIAPTNLTSLVMWVGNSDVITVRKAPFGGPANRKLDIMVGSVRRFFEQPSEIWQDLRGVSVVNNAATATHAEDQLHSNFTILFNGGEAVQVAERQGLLHAVVILPPGAQQTQGLMGTLDGDSTNDFRAPYGNVINELAGEDSVYTGFSLLWNVNRTESKFQWPKDTEMTRSPLFGDPATFPYTDPNMQPNEYTVQSTCQNSVACRRDYYATADRTVAIDTKSTEERFEVLQLSQNNVSTCGLLDIPMAVKTSNDYTLGSVVRVTGCRPDDSPVINAGAATEYTCSLDSSSQQPVWTPTPVTMCPIPGQEASSSSSDVGMIVGITIGVVAAIVIAVVIVVLILRRRKSDTETSEDQPVPAKRNTVPSDVARELGTDEAFLKRGERDEVRMGNMRRPPEHAV